MRKTGLARALSKLGFCSRAQAIELVRAGRVAVNGRVRRDPESATTDRDRISVDGNPAAPAARVYVMLNKPRGLVTTRSDEKGRPTIYDCLGAPHLPSFGRCGNALPWLAPVGRLDQASEGLLLLTNDSEWAARITDPAEHLDKLYHVQINRVANEDVLRALTEGVCTSTTEGVCTSTTAAPQGRNAAFIDHARSRTPASPAPQGRDAAFVDHARSRTLASPGPQGRNAFEERARGRTLASAGPQGRNMKARHGSAGKVIPSSDRLQSRRDGIHPELLRAKSARILRTGGKNSWLEIVLDEGRNRQIRRMLDALGVDVLRLVRVAIGPLQLGELPKAQWRELTQEEKRAIDRALSRT